jgi:prolyl-tRNA synthetase
VGMRDCVSIKSNPGMMGGKVSHEFMAIAECGRYYFHVAGRLIQGEPRSRSRRLEI